MKKFNTELTARMEICAERAGGKKALALACAISLPQLFRYVKGQAILPTDRLVNIARASNVHPYWLLTGEGTPDIPPVQSFLSEDQTVTIDAKSLTESITLAEQIDRDYDFKMTPSRKAEFIFALYHGAAYEARLTGTGLKFETSKALEIYGLIAGIQADIARKIVLNTVEIVTKAANEQLPDIEIRSFCNYLNSAIKDLYNHPTLSQPYYDRVGYTLEPDTAEFIDNLVSEIKKEHMFRSEVIRILDLGCGNGRHLLHFCHDPRIRASGLDNNQLSKTVCQTYEASGKLAKGTFVEGDMFKLPFTDNTFDLVFANASIFHTPFFVNSTHGLNHVMQEIRRVLRPKGLIYIHSRYGAGFEPFPFFQLHNEGTIRQLCQKNAFNMVWFKKFFWQDSIEYIPKVRFNDWFSTLLSKGA